MTASSGHGLYLAVLHFPVTNKLGEEICSSVSGLDIHDIARASATYGVRRFYVVTPVADQQELAQSIIGHWITGHGAGYNPKRKRAIELVRLAEDLAGVIEEIRRETGREPKTVATDARGRPDTLGYGEFQEKLGSGDPLLLMLGTAWGLTETFMQAADFVLEPVHGPTDYNHLSVRSAAAVILDRVLGKRAGTAFLKG